MFTELKFSEARAGLTLVFDQVQDDVPVVVKPRKQSEITTYLLNDRIMHDILAASRFSIREIREETGEFTYWMDTFDEYGSGETEEEAMNSLVSDAIFYAEDYIKNIKRYYNSPNRRHHMPFVLRILMCNTPGEVKEMFLKDAAQVQGA